jgi:uncharacterized protein YbaP (TraB family)
MNSITGFYRLTCLLVWLLLATPVQALSPVWMVEKNGARAFVGGTMHILTAEDYPLPNAFETAYRQSGEIVFETDMAKMQDPAFQQHLLGAVSYHDGRKLRQVISADTYSALTAFFTERGVAMASIDNFKPGMVATLMTIVELQRLGVNGVGVDAYFNQRAVSDGKALGQLETVEEQVDFIANMGAGQEDAMLNYNLADIERLADLWQSMTQAWRGGDLAWLEQQVALPMQQDFPEVYQTLLVDRNDAWIPQLEAMFTSAQVEFVLVGALHLVGQDGLLAKLGARGYRITQLP